MFLEQFNNHHSNNIEGEKRVGSFSWSHWKDDKISCKMICNTYLIELEAILKFGCYLQNEAYIFYQFCICGIGVSSRYHSLLFSPLLNTPMLLSYVIK